MELKIIEKNINLPLNIEMYILVFDGKYVETAHAVEIRTGLSILKNNWEPEKNAVYIVYGAHKQTDILLQVQEKLNTTYVIMNDVSPQEFKDTNYEILLQKNYVLEQEMEDVDYLAAGRNMNVEYVSHESFKNENKNEDNHRPIDFLYAETNSLKELFKDPAIKRVALSETLEYSVNQLTQYYVNAKCYISHRKRDWININKAISCGCRVISCLESEAMMTIYKDYVVFKENIDLECEVNPDFRNFQLTITTFSLNKYLPLIHKLFDGISKNEDKHSSAGKIKGS